MSETPSRSIPWFRVAVEGLVIVASVLIALGADAWWEGQQQLQAEQLTLLGLQADLEATLGAIAVDKRENEQVANAAERLISLGGSERLTISAPRMDTLLAQVLPGEDFAPVDATLSALLSSEGLSVISNPDLRALLAQWPSALARVRRTEAQEQTLLFNRFLPYLHERVPIRALDAISSPAIGSLPSAHPVDARELLNDLRFENHVNDVLFFTRTHVQWLVAFEDLVVRTLALVNQELAEG